MRSWLAIGLFCLALTAAADESVTLCYNWSCASEVTAEFAEALLDEIGALMLDADSPAHERELLAVAIGRLYGWAGERLPIGADRAGNRADAEVDGRMDCIDHSTNTTNFLNLFERRGWLHFHRPAAAQFRKRFLVLPVHRTAVIEEMPPGLGVVGGETSAQFAGRYFAVDSWLVDSGQSVVILPLAEWMKGGGPDVE